MIPLPQILAELVMALGGALLVASVLALVRARRVPGSGLQVRATARGRLLVNAFIGLVVLVWGFASFITKNGV